MGRFRAVAGAFAGTFPNSAVGTASIGWASGNDLEVVQEQLGHASIKTTTIYARVTKEDKLRAADALGKVDRDSLVTSPSVWPLFIRSSVVMANESSSSGSHPGEDSLGSPKGPPSQRK